MCIWVRDEALGEVNKSGDEGIGVVTCEHDIAVPDIMSWESDHVEAGDDANCSIRLSTHVTSRS